MSSYKQKELRIDSTQTIDQDKMLVEVKFDSKGYLQSVINKSKNRQNCVSEILINGTVMDLEKSMKLDELYDCLDIGHVQGFQLEENNKAFQDQ